MKKFATMFVLSSFLVLSFGFNNVYAESTDTTTRIVYYTDEIPSDQVLIELAKVDILYEDKNVKVEKSTFNSGELTIIQTKITKHISTTIKSDATIDSYSIVLLNEMYKQKTFAVGVMEAYLAYESTIFDDTEHFKVVLFGHRLISYESLFGSPVSLTSVAIQDGLGTLDGNHYMSRHDVSTSFITTSGFFTRQSRDTYFTYFIENTILSGAGVDTTIKWRNKTGTYSYFVINSLFILNTI